MTASLVYWPLEFLSSRSANANVKGKRVLRPQEQKNGGVITIVRNPPSLTIDENISAEEEYYDAPTSPVTRSATAIHASSSSEGSKPLFQVPHIETTNLDGIDWRTLEPPKELFDVPFETPVQIKNIIKSSVESVQRQIAQEKSASIETKRQEVAALEPENGAERSLPRGFETQGLQSESSQGQSSDVNGPISPSGGLGQSSGAPKRRRRSFFFSTWSRLPYSTSAIVKPSMEHARSISLTAKSPSQRFQSSTGRTECVSCLDEFMVKEVVILKCHGYCKPCFQSLISTALGSETYWPPKCCLNEIPVEDLLPHMDKQTRNTYKKIAEERSVPAGERVYCSSCATWVPPRNINMAIACAACPSCKKKTCTSCRDAYHPNGECPSDPNMRATLQLATDQGWRRCYSCSALVEHNQGCLHMTCKCKAQFCYVCGVKWRECICNDTDLANVLQTAQTRRFEAQAHEREAEARQRTTSAAETAAARQAEQDAAELAEILERIEKYEMEEAIQLASEEEQRRLEAVAARQQRQEKGILAITKKYFELRNDLEFLHALQKVAISERFDEELSRLEFNMEREKEKHEKEVKILDAEGQLKQREENWRLHREYAARKKRELEIEEKYVKELREYWRNISVPNPELEITKARDKLRDDHRESHKKWEEKENVKVNEIAAEYEVKIEELKRGQSDVIAEFLCRSADKKWEIGRISTASQNWLEEVQRIRMRVLIEMEEAECVAILDDDF